MLTVSRTENPHDQLKRLWKHEAIRIVDQQTAQRTAKREGMHCSSFTVLAVSAENEN